MKTISQTYKDNIKQLGKEITYEITYDNTTLGDADILNANLHYDGGMLKSVMKQLDIELYNDLPIGTELTYKFGVKVDDTNYEKINYGNFIVYSSEKLEDSNTYKLVCYDKMLYAMKDYEALKNKNLFDKNSADIGVAYIDSSTGAIINGGGSTTIKYYEVEPNTQYTLTAQQLQRLAFYNSSKTKLLVSSTTNTTFTTPANTKYVSIQLATSTFNVDTIQLEKGSTATNFVPYFEYPTTIRDYTTILCDNLGLTFANTSDDFTNYDKTIENELYIDNEGNNIGYTYRDVLDELAQATASTICINDNDELEIRYITNANEEKASISGTSFNMTAHDNKVDIDLLGNTKQNTTTGKNLLKNTSTNSGDKNYWYQYSTFDEATGTLTRSVNTTSESYITHRINLKNNTKYTISCLAKSNGYVSSFEIFAFDPSFAKIYHMAGTSLTTNFVKYSFTFTTDASTNFTNASIRFDNNGSTQSGTDAILTIKDVMLVEGEDTDFEPYTYGASPNPNYPQPIETITGRNTIDVWGKNMFDESQLLQATGWKKENNIYFGTIGDYYTKFRYGFTGLHFKTNTQYTISLKGYTTGGTPRVQIVYTDNSSELINIYASTMTSYIKTTNASKSVSNIKVDYGTGSANILYLSQFMIEEGSTATTYEPYKGNNYEVNLGKNLYDASYRTTSDTIFCANGTATESNGVFILTATETDLYMWQVAATGTAYNKNTCGKLYEFVDDEYTITTTNQTIKANYITFYDENKVSLGYIGFGGVGYTRTIKKGVNNVPSNAKYFSLRFGYNQAVVNDNYSFSVQLEKGNQATSYSPYFEPIELCKIGTYQDRLFKSSGKNLANNNFEDYDITDGSYAILPIKLEYGKTYVLKATLVGEQKANYYNFGVVKDGTTYNNFVGLTLCVDYSTGTALQRTFTIDNTYTNPKLVCFIQRSQTKFNELFTNYNIQLEKSSSATSFEPYGKNEWWLKKAINKISITGGMGNAGVSNTFYTTSIIDYATSDNAPYSQYYTGVNNVGGASGMSSKANNTIAFRNLNGSTDSRFYIKDERYANTDYASLNTWLSNNPLNVYYALATPTYTKIENEELIGQLEHIRLLNGYNNVISSSPITLDYVSSIDTIDEEYLKDINVNFGEEVKPINTITFKRSGDTDVISLSYPEDLEDDKKNEIAISENQILNYDNRDEYLKGILDRLYGLTYCLNDYTSTGITYYDLCDRYEVSITKTDVDGNAIETNYYPCIMFNDEINVNQGLQEIVHTDRAEESITDYTTTTKTDRLKTRTDLIVNKQEGFIEAVTGSLQIGEDGQSEVVNGVVSRQTETERTINVITSFDENGNPIGVKTEKGFTFDKNGLNITSSDNTYKTQIDEQGTYYYDGDEILGQTTKEGSKFKNMDLYGEFHYGMDKITDTPLFVSMAYKDGSEDCFGHFWNSD